MKTLDYTPELFADIVANQIDWHQLGETVCGAEDPAVIHVSYRLGRKYPELAGLTVVRVTERYVNPWKSDTIVEFSDREITDEEYAQYDELAGE